jgi:hypothetical protein
MLGLLMNAESEIIRKEDVAMHSHNIPELTEKKSENSWSVLMVFSDIRTGHLNSNSNSSNNNNNNNNNNNVR